jgi:hypothetical protein
MMNLKTVTFGGHTLEAINEFVAHSKNTGESIDQITMDDGTSAAIIKDMIAMLAAAPAPVAQSAGQEAGGSVGAWLRTQLLDYCEGACAPVPDVDDLFAIADRAKRKFDAAPVNGGERDDIEQRANAPHEPIGDGTGRCALCGSDDESAPIHKQVAGLGQARMDDTAARYAWIVSKARFSTAPGQPTVMSLSLELPATNHNPHTDWMGERFVESFNRTIDSARTAEDDDDE